MYEGKPRGSTSRERIEKEQSQMQPESACKRTVVHEGSPARLHPYFVSSLVLVAPATRVLQLIRGFIGQRAQSRRHRCGFIEQCT